MGKDTDDLLTILKTSAKLAGRQVKKVGTSVYETAKETYQKEAEKLPEGMSTGEQAGTIAGKYLGRSIEGLVGLAKLGVKAGKKFLEDKEILDPENTNPIRCYEAIFSGTPQEYEVKSGEELTLKVTQEATPGKFYAIINHTKPEAEKILAAYGVKLGTEIPLEEYMQKLTETQAKKPKKKRATKTKKE